MAQYSVHGGHGSGKSWRYTFHGHLFEGSSTTILRLQRIGFLECYGPGGSSYMCMDCSYDYIFLERLSDRISLRKSLRNQPHYYNDVGISTCIRASVVIDRTIVNGQFLRSGLPRAGRCRGNADAQEHRA